LLYGSYKFIEGTIENVKRKVNGRGRESEKTIKQYKGYIESEAEAVLGGRGSNP